MLSIKIYFKTTEIKIYDNKIEVKVKDFSQNNNDRKKKISRMAKKKKKKIGQGQFWWVGRSSANQQFFKVGLNLLKTCIQTKHFFLFFAWFVAVFTMGKMIYLFIIFFIYFFFYHWIW